MFRIVQFFVILFATASLATEFIPSSLPSQTSEVPLIVRGTIGMTYSDWGSHDDGGRGIFTFYQLQPTEVMKGQVADGATILFREIGGEKDGVGETVPGAAQFTRGEDVIVMLGPQNKDGSYDLRGLSAGKFNITHEEDGSESLSSAALAPPPHPGKWTVADMKKAIHDQGATPQVLASPTTSLTKNSAAMPSSTVSKSENRTAPQLQTSEAESAGAKGSDSLFFKIVAAAGVILIGFVVMRALRKDQSKR